MKSVIRDKRWNSPPLTRVLFGLCCLTLLLLAGPAFAGTYYVREDGTGDGTSWNKASSDLAGILDSASSGDEIWVAGGTYKPTDGTDRTKSFTLTTGVALYGGFAPTGTPVFDDRSVSAYKTVLTGDIGTEGDDSDNSYHVLYSGDGVSTATVDGFTVTGGNADGSTGYRLGGGMDNESSGLTVMDCTFSGNSAAGGGGGMANGSFSSSTVTNCTFSGNSTDVNGGGMLNDVNSTPEVTNCTFSGNSAGTLAYCSGGGMYNYGCSPKVTNCTFSGNSAGSLIYCRGGGMYNYNSSPQVTNCTFSGNRASMGGGMANKDGSTPQVMNCTFSGNSADSGHGMHNDGSVPTVSNCIFWDKEATYEFISSATDTVTLSNCVVRGGYTDGTDTTSIIDEDPLLQTLADNGGPTWTCALGTGSSAIDAGKTLSSVTKDQRGVSRPVGSGYDIGAYEVDEWFTVTVTTNTGGTVTAYPYGTILSGEAAGVSKQFTADDTPGFVITPEESMDLTGVWVDGTEQDFAATGATVTLDSLSADCELTATFAVKTFSITGTVSGGHGQVTAAPASVDWGDSSTVTVDADDYCHIDWIEMDGSSIDIGTMLGQHTVTLSDISADHTVEAAFVQDRYTLTVVTDGTGSGDVSLDPPGGFYEKNASVTLTSTPADSSSFTGWSGANGGEVVTSGDAYTITMDGDKTVTATFDLKTFTITATAGTGGSVSPATAGITWGTSHTVNITADSGYAIDNVLVDGASAGDPASYTFSDVQTTHTLAASFKPLDVSLTSADLRADPDAALMDTLADVADGGTITFSDDIAGETFVFSDAIQIAQNVTLVAPDGGLTLSGGGNSRVFYIEAGGDVTLEGFTIASGDAGDENGGGILNEGTLNLTECTLTDNKAAYGGGLYNGKDSSAVVTNCTFSGNSANAYGGGMYNDYSSLTVSNCTFSNNDAASEGGGMYSNYSSPTVTNCIFWENDGGEIDNYSCTPTVTYCVVRDGYGGTGNTDEDPLLQTLADNGGSTRTCALLTGSSAIDAGLTLKSVATDQRGVARPTGASFDIGAYEAEWFTVTVSADPGGTVSVGPYGTILSGDVTEISKDFTADDTPSFVIIPEESTDLTGVWLDKAEQSFDVTGTTVTLEPLSADHELEATFAVKTFSIYTTAVGSGDVSASPVSVDWGQNSTVTVSADSHYHIDTLSVDGASHDFSTASKDYSFTFENVSDDHSVEAAFAIDSHTLTVVTGGAGTGSVDPAGGTYDYGTVETLTATPADSSNFTGWSGAVTGSAASSTVTMDADRSVTATFALKSFIITATAGEGGSVSPGTATVDWDGSHTVTITPDPAQNASISKVFVDGVSVGAVESYTFDDVREDHTLRVLFLIDEGTVDSGGTVDIHLDAGEVSAVGEVLDGTAGLDLPKDLSDGTVSFDLETPVDLGYLLMDNVSSGDVDEAVASAEPGGVFLTGVSFDVVASGESENVGLLPVDLQFVVSEDSLSERCREGIEADEPDMGLAEAFLSHVSILKVISGDTYDLYNVAFEASLEPEDFFTVSRDEGNFLVGVGLIVADTAAEGVDAVQAIPASGDCRFLVFDGADDGHYRDPVVAVEPAADSSDGGGGCSALPLPGLALLMLPLLGLMKK